MNLKTLLDELLRSSSPSFASTLINNDWFLSQMSYHYIAERIRNILLSHDGVDSTQVLPHHCMSWKNGFGRVIVHHHHWDALLIVLWWWSEYERRFHHTFRIQITFRHSNIVFCCPDGLANGIATNSNTTGDGTTLPTHAQATYGTPPSPQSYNTTLYRPDYVRAYPTIPRPFPTPPGTNYATTLSQLPSSNTTLGFSTTRPIITSLLQPAPKITSNRRTPQHQNGSNHHQDG